MSNKEKASLTPKLRFPEFRRDSGWHLKRIGDYLTESRLPGSKGDVAKKITVKLWGNGVFEKNEAIQGSVNTQYFQRKAGQFIYSKLDFLNQAFGIIPAHLDNYETTVDLPCFDVSGALNAAFLLEYVSRKEFYEKVGEAADGSRKARRIHAETFLSFLIALPSSVEQQKIADCLNSLDELVAAQARKVGALRTHKNGLMQRLFPRAGETHPRLRFPEFQRARAWEARTLGELVSIHSGSTPSKSNSEYWTGSIPWVSAKDMKKLFLDDAKDHISTAAIDDGARLVPPGALLILTRGMTLLKDIPICVLKREMSFNQDVKALRPKKGVNGLFLALMLMGNKQRLLEMVDIAGHGTGKLNTDELRAFSLMLPSPKEQQRIADCLAALEDHISAAIQQLDALKSYKRGLMQQLFPSPEAVEA
jgi:type I restriction enzyme S subunit